MELISLLQSVCENIDFEKENHLISDRIIDSLDFVRIVIAIEQEYKIAIPTECLNSRHFDSVESIDNLIRNLKNEK